jgi:hypothetical protein
MVRGEHRGVGERVEGSSQEQEGDVVRRADTALSRPASASTHDEIVVVPFVQAHLEHGTNHGRIDRVTREMTGYHLERTRRRRPSRACLGFDDCAVRGSDNDEGRDQCPGTESRARTSAPDLDGREDLIGRRGPAADDFLGACSDGVAPVGRVGWITATEG